jgi:hypothetical protein
MADVLLGALPLLMVAALVVGVGVLIVALSQSATLGAGQVFGCGTISCGLVIAALGVVILIGMLIFALALRAD